MNEDIVYGVGFGEILFSAGRMEIVQKLGKPLSTYISELSYPAVLIDEYSDQGISLYYDFRTEVRLFAILVTRKSGAKIRGESLFGKTFREMKEWQVDGETIDLDPILGTIFRVTKVGVDLTFSGSTIADESKVQEICTYASDDENLLYERMKEKKTSRALTVEEREIKYAHLKLV